MSSAQGQAKPHAREGFWIGFGLGYGSLGCEGCDSRESSQIWSFKLGGTLNRRVLVGAELNYWYKEFRDTTASHWNDGVSVFG